MHCCSGVKKQHFLIGEDSFSSAHPAQVYILHLMHSYVCTCVCLCAQTHTYFTQAGIHWGPGEEACSILAIRKPAVRLMLCFWRATEERLVNSCFPECPYGGARFLLPRGQVNIHSTADLETSVMLRDPYRAASSRGHRNLRNLKTYLLLSYESPFSSATYEPHQWWQPICWHVWLLLLQLKWSTINIL